jgi:hypothetical protein
MKGLVDPQRLEEFFEQDAVTTFSGFVEEQTALRGADEFLKFRLARPLNASLELLRRIESRLRARPVARGTLTTQHELSGSI